MCKPACSGQQPQLSSAVAVAVAVAAVAAFNTFLHFVEPVGVWYVEVQRVLGDIIPCHGFTALHACCYTMFITRLLPSF